VSYENKKDPDSDVPSHFTEVLTTFEDSEKNLQIEVFGAERLTKDIGQEADTTETLELKRAVLAMMDDVANTEGNDMVAYRILQRRWKPAVELHLFGSTEERGLDVRDTDHWLAQAPLRVKNLLFEHVDGPQGRLAQSRLARILGIGPPLLHTASESIYFDQDDKAWVVRSLVYPYARTRDALRSKEQDTAIAIKPASHADIDGAFELLTAAAREDEQASAYHSLVK